MFVKTVRNWLRKSKPTRRTRPGQYRRLCFERLEELALLTTFTVTNTADSGAGSLRQAVISAMASAGNTVAFDISGSGVQTIDLTSTDPTYTYSALPLITNSVTIDGTTQPGYSGSPVIQIDGSMESSSFLDCLYVIAGSCTVKGLDFTGFSGTAIVLSSDSNTIENNYIGTDPTGTTADGNQGGGIAIYGGATNQIVQNVISGNSFSGGSPTYYSAVYVANAGANGNVIAGNYIGANAAGTAALGNGGAGIYVAGGAQNTLIGADGSSSASDAAARNVISANSGEGVIIEGTSSGADTTGTIVAGNYIGTNASGSSALGNQSDGVFIGGGAQNTRLGVSTSDADPSGERNVISGNEYPGVGISDPGTEFNVVAGNYIGTNAAGTAALPNGSDGLFIGGGAENNRIGVNGPDANASEEGNVISGNMYQGVGIDGTSSGANTTGNIVAGNYIGTNATGTAALPNTDAGVYVYGGAQDNRIGANGPDTNASAERNVISGNAYEGAVLSDPGTNSNTVAGNYIGTNAAGTAPLSNGSDGIDIINGAEGNLIGASGSGAGVAAEANVIAANTDLGVEIQGSSSGANTTNNVVAGNYIGTNAAGATDLGNGASGILISAGAQSNQVGGSTALADVIAYNAQTGVAVTGAGTTGDSIRFNSIFGNGGIGIDLGSDPQYDGVQVNHAGTTSGPNNLQNYPLITAATPGSTTVISGTLTSLASTAYTLDFYADTTPDITFYGPGRTYLGSTSVTTNSSGTAAFTATLSAATTTGEWVTATATDPSGDTSEFSGDRELPYSTPALSESTWTQLGPDAIAQSPEFTGPVMSGRIETAAPDPDDPNIMYVAADGGGVWETTDWLATSPTWVPLTDSQSSTVTGSGDYTFDAMAVYPGNPAIIYAAAGGPGGGVLKSTNGGQAWTLLGNSVFNQAAFGSLTVDPDNSNIVYVSVLYGPNANSGGVYESTNGGATWTNITSAFFTGWASDVVIDPANPSVLYAGLTQDTMNTSVNGVYESTNGGSSWTQLSGLVPAADVGDGIRIAIAPSSPQTVYATVFDTSLGDPTDYPYGVPHRFSTTNGGASWTSLPALPTDEEFRFWHVMLAVDPNNPQVLYVNGDHTVYVSTNGGSTWSASPIDDSEDPVGGYFDDSGDLILTGDHGIYRVTNVDYANYTFYNKQGNLDTSEFYTLTLDPTDADIIYGLAQDQFAPLKYTGYPVWNSTGQAPNGEDSEGVGEVGKILVDPSSPNIIYQYAPLDDEDFTLVSTDGGATWNQTGLTNQIPTTLNGFGLGYASQKAFVMDPTNPQRLLVGTNQVYETTDGGTSWTSISGVLSTSSDLSDQYITALAIAPSSTNTIYAATAGGQLFVTQNDGGSWTEVDTGLPVDPYDQIVSIQVDPADADEVFIVPGTFPTNVFGAAQVWMTTTGGAMVGGNEGWTAITGNLPSEDWTNAIAVDWRPATPVLYVATARGVYQSADLGAHWSLFGEALPNSPVTDLQIDTGLNVLAAATYGRGVWEIELGAVNSVWTGSQNNPNWNIAANWAGSSLPVAGDNLVFPAGAAQLTNSNDLTANTLFGNVVFGAGGYSVSGNAIELNGAIDGSASSGTTTFNIPVTLEGASSVLTGGTGSLITIGQTINTNGFTLTVGGGPGQTSFTSNISGSGGLSVDTEAGVVELSGTNSYSGGTTVLSGVLQVTNSTALPDGGSLTVGAGGILILDSSASASPITTSGATTAVSDTATGDTSATTAAPVAATVTSAGPALPSVVSAPRNVVGQTMGPGLLPSAQSASTTASRTPVADQFVGSSISKGAAGDLAWLEQTANNSDDSDQQRKKDVAILALDAVFAQYGQ